MAFERKYYRYRTWGDDAAIFLLDTRSFRSQTLDPPNPLDPNSVATFLADSFDPTRTMLGPAQLKTLLEDLQQAQDDGITWKFVVVPEPIQNLGPVFAEDRFGGYAAERATILRHIDQNFISNVVFVAADLHGTVVNNLAYQSSPLGRQLAAPAFEVITGSVAFDEPFGPTAVDLAAELGIVTPEQLALYETLPRDGKDLFFSQLIDQQVDLFGYNRVGLEGSGISATLEEGNGWVAAHTFGWSEFDIDDDTDTLRVTTYGIDPYGEDDLATDPTEVVSRTPEVVQQFSVDAVRPCLPGQGALCLGNGRFALEVEWTDFTGTTGVGTPVELTPDSGYFYFFRPGNIELVVKALDGRELNDSRWIYYGALTNVAFRMTVTDRQTGQVRTYDNPSGVFASNGDVDAFPQILDVGSVGEIAALGNTSFDVAGLARELEAELADRAERAASQVTAGAPPVTQSATSASKTTTLPTKDCTASATTLCLNQNRFRASATFTIDGVTRQASSAPLTGDTGYFWFGSLDNVELVVKVLDGQSLNDAFWVFYASLSNLEFEIRVTDTDTGDVVTYQNDGGAFASVGDTSAFPQDG